MRMKDYFNLRKSKWLLLTLLTMIVGGVNSAWADELTVYDGTETNEYVPTYGYCGDYATKGEIIIPSTEISSMSGNIITGLTFYLSSSSGIGFIGNSSSVIKVFLKEVSESAFASTSFYGYAESDVVYSGTLSVSDDYKMTVTFDKAYNYSGGNLLVGIYKTTTGGNYPHTYFYGQASSKASVNAYSSSGIGSVGATGTSRDFLPKTTFSYTSASGYVAPPSGLAASNVTNTSALLNWTSDGSEWNLQYKKAADDDWTAANGLTSTSYSLTGLTAETAYQARVQTVDGSNLSDWTSVVSFTTKPEPVTTFPFTENFNSLTSGIPARWDNSEGTTTTDSYKWNYYATGHEGAGLRFNSYNNQSGIWNALKTPAMNLPAGKVMQLSFWYKNPAGGDFSVCISNDGGDTYTTALATGLTGQNDWKQVEYNIPTGFENNVVIVFKGTSNYGNGDAYIYLDDVTVEEAPMEAKLVVETENIAFGMVDGTATQDLVVKNGGAAQMSGVTVSYAATTGDADAITLTPALSGASIDANGQQTVAVAVNSEKKGAFSGVITVAADGQTSVEIPVSGYTLDDTKILETFASASSVSRWTVASGWTFNASTGAYSGTSSRVMTSPKLSVAAGNVLALNVKLGWSGGSLIVEGLDADGNTVYDPVTYNSSNGGLNTSSFTLLTIDDMPTTVAKVKLTGYYAYINVFNGFTYVNDPVLGIFSNEECTSAQASPATKIFGFATEAQNQLYYIKNTGNGQIDLTIEQADGFTAAVDNAALAEGEKATLTVTMTATEGLHDGTITVTAKNHDNAAVLGTFVVNANGAITGSKNNVVLTAFPAGWQNSNWTISNGAARNWSSTSSDLITTTLTVTEGEKLLVEAYKYYSSDDSQLSYSYSTDGGSNWSAPVSLTSQLTTSYKIIAISGIPAGNVLMKFSGTYTYIRQIYGFEAFAEPIMEFAAAGTTKSFGMITSKTTSDEYTITNSGTALLDNLSVTCDNKNFEIAVAENAKSIAAGGSVTFTVALNTTALGSQTGTVTISGDGVADKTFTVKGYVADSEKIFTTFTALPSRWTNTSSPAWSFSETGAYAGSYAYSGGYNYATLTSPKVTISEGQKLYISAKLSSNSSSYYVKVEGSSDNGDTWTTYKTLSNDVLTNTDYTVVEIDNIPTTVNKIRLVGYYVYVNGLNGFNYDDNDPEFAMFSDYECATPIEGTTATNAWGFVSEDKTATYYIKNTDTGTMTLSKTDAPAGFTATLAKNSLGAGESTTLTILMANDAENNEGYHAGDVVLTAKDNADNTLGTFTVTSSGVVVGSKTDINFTTLTDFPAGWDGGTYWSVTANTKATIGYNSGTLTTGTYTVAEGESLVIEGKGNSSWSAPTLTYQYSVNGGAWTTGTSPLSFSYSTSTYSIQTISDIPVGNVVIKFTGTYMDIQRIYGYTAVAKANIALDKADDYDFGMQTADAEYVITVTNNGTAEMTGLTATLTTGTDYSVEVNKTTLAINETATVTVTQKFDASKGLASLSDELTISADDIAGKSIKLSGKTRDASKWYVDFAEGSIPSSFVESGSWSASSYYASTTSSTETSLITQPITLAAGEKIQFEAKNPYSGSLKVRYSVNGGISWSDYTDYTSQLNTSSFTALTLDLEKAEAVTAIVEFKGRYYIQLDNIYGGALNNTAPMIKVTKSAAVVENGATEAFGSIKAEATATYTITNVGNGSLTITDPVAKTGAATATISANSLANGESATLTITMPVEAPYEYKEGVVTVETSLGDFVINYNATVLNPNALDEQFASGKPAGWYFGGYWKVSGQQAMQEDSGTAEDLITEQLTVAGTSDVLTFQAARTSNYSAPTFKVYTSQDRVAWNEVDLSGLTLTTSYQDVNISGLAAGDYYVKISGARVKVDNFLGWTKKNNTHDLYVTATSFPATTTKGNSATISATVTSLIAAETGVYAKLFINGAVEATTDAQDIALNGTKTFSFNYAIPENKTAQIKVYYSDNAEAFATAENAMKVNYAFDEEVDPSTITAGTFNVTMTRTFNEGWNTICVPFAMSAEQIEAAFGADAKAYEFDNFADGVLSFQKVTSLTAATPYLIYLPDAVSSTLTINDAVVSDTEAQTLTKGEIDFVGTYAPITAPGMEGKWGVTAAGKIGKGSDTAFINGFRAYFNGSLAGARISIFGDDETTVILGVMSQSDVVKGDVYNLNGQKVENLKKGNLYIVNGKKVVIK